MNRYKIAGIVVAAGNSSRMKSEKSKLLLSVNNETVIKRSVKAMEESTCIDEIIIVTRDDDRDEIKQEVAFCKKNISYAKGGKDRQDSVLNGVKMAENCDIIAIHDGARPLVTQKEIECVILDCIKYGAATLGIVPKDTIKIVNEDGFVESTPNRDNLRQISTPQVFFRENYLKAIERAKIENKSFTDDCQLIENNGGKVYVSKGEYTNIKITTPEDIRVAEAIINEKKEDGLMRIGHGYDVHKLVEGRKLIIGGVEIPFEKGLLGHSDADVLLHAISDSLLGAAALGDIGKHFPDNDPEFEGADSLVLLTYVVNLLIMQGYRIVNIDATVVAQRPKMSPYVEKMRENIAFACQIPTSVINVKATTEEGMGFTGRGDGISAHSIALISKL